MSSIAKIFIIVNLLLSALVLGWASTHLGSAQDWKAKHASLQSEMTAQVGEKETMISGLRGEKGALEESRDAARAEGDQAAAMRDRNAADLAKSQEEANTLRARLDSIDSTLNTYAETNDNLQARFEQASNDARSADEARREAESSMEEAQAARTEAQTQLDNANNQLTQLMTEKNSLEKRLAETETQVAILVQATGVDVGSIIGQPRIEGAVLDVDTSLTPGLIAINKGANDQVKRGYTFHLWSGGTYKGKARVETVQDNLCTAVILQTFKGAQVTQGDRASTQL